MLNLYTIVKLSFYSLCSLYLTTAFTHPALAQISEADKIVKLTDISLIAISGFGAVSSLVIGLVGMRNTVAMGSTSLLIGSLILSMMSIFLPLISSMAIIGNVSQSLIVSILVNVGIFLGTLIGTLSYRQG